MYSSSLLWPQCSCNPLMHISHFQSQSNIVPLCFTFFLLFTTEDEKPSHRSNSLKLSLPLRRSWGYSYDTGLKGNHSAVPEVAEEGVWFRAGFNLTLLAACNSIITTPTTTARTEVFLSALYEGSVIKATQNQPMNDRVYAYACLTWWSTFGKSN